ncbi:MAG: CHAT domain-containing tetratricopeptide repeat protein [Thermoanaerobaculia bacterium]
MISIRTAAILFLAFVAPSMSAGTPNTAARDAVDALLAGTFTDPRADVAAFQQAIRRFECVRPLGTSVTATTVAGEDAFVEVLVAATGDLPLTRVPREFPPRWRVHLRRNGDAWRVIGIDSVERGVAAALAFSEPSVQETVLRNCDALVSPELVYQLVELGVVLGARGQYAREERIASIALAMAEDLRDPLSRARALWLLARAKDTTEAYDDALTLYEEARALADAHGDRETTGRALVGYGFTQVNRYDFANAKEPLQKGLAIALSLGDHMIADNAYLAMSSMDLLSGEYVEALRDLDRAREHAEKAGDRAVVAAATANSGLAFHEMNSYYLAADRLREAIAVYRELGNVRGEMRNLRNLADVEASVHRDETASRYLDRVEAYLAAAPNDRMSAFAAATRATIARHRHDLDQADRETARALALAAKIDDQYLVTMMTNQLSEIRLTQGKNGEAADLAEKAVALSLTLPALRPVAELSAAKAYEKLGRTDDAFRALHTAVESIESLTANVPGTEEEQQTFYYDKTGAYYELFHMLVEQQQPEAAIEWIERSRSRSLMDYLGRNKVSADRDILSAEERKEELAREQELVALNRSLREPVKDTKTAARIEEEIRQKRLSLQEYKARLYRQYPQLALARGALPRPSLPEIQKLIPPDGAIVEYIVDTDVTWLVVLQNTGRPHIVRIDIEDADLGSRVDAFAQQIAQRDLGSHANARALYELLVKPADAVLRSKKSLCLIPDGPLWRLPFQALVDGRDKYLVERNTMFYTPSLSLLAWYATHAAKHAAKGNVLVLANPRLTEQTIRMAHAIQRDENLAPLPEAEEEARQIEAMYGGDVRVVTGTEATEAFLKHNAARYRIIHLATHATFNDTSPLHSHLVLAAGRDATEDGLLEAHEIMNLDFAPDLVILSSCETGRGELRGGDGLVGMSWALLVAGCPTAVVSQWKVGSASTAKLMTEFHRRLSRVPRNDRRRAAVRALREAHLVVMHMPQYRYPFDWSAFIVVGNGW